MENFVISSCLVGHTLSLSLPLTQYSCTSHMCRLPISLTSPTTPTRSHLLLHSLFLIHVTREGSFTLSLSHPSISHIYRFSLSLSLAYVTYVGSLFFFSLSRTHTPRHVACTVYRHQSCLFLNLNIVPYKQLD